MKKEKKKIILYGADDVALMEKIKRYLFDEYEIIESDSSIEGKEIVRDDSTISQIKKLGNDIWDFYLILERDEEKQLVVKNILVQECGVNSERIVIPRILFREDEYSNIPDLCAELESEPKQVDTAIFGMSYSLRGIDRDILNATSIDFSWHGGDLYYNYGMAKWWAGQPKTVLMVFPYYYFGYDMSMSEYEYRTGQIFAYRGLSNWHNYYKSPNIKIHDYMKSYEMFGEKIFMHNQAKRNIMRNTNQMTETTNVKIEDGWKRFFAHTYSENEDIFRRFLKLYEGSKKYVIIPPFYRLAIQKEDWTFIEKKKEEFYGLLDQFRNEITVMDYLDDIQTSDYFVDWTHLNERGRKAFTEMINKDIFD